MLQETVTLTLRHTLGILSSHVATMDTMKPPMIMSMSMAKVGIA